MFKKAVLYIALIFFSSLGFAQVKGKLTAPNGEPVPFANITVAGTFNGTSSNEDGLYTLNIKEKDTYTIIFQSLGFKSREVKIEITKLPFVLDVTLQEEQYTLDEVVIGNENPANTIIENAIKNRKANSAKTAQFEADFYSRGVFWLKDVPKKILGQQVGDLGASLDTTRSGIVYLSETVSRVKYQKPDKIHEQVIASKVSGEDNGYSFNNAQAAEFDFYENTLPFEVRVVSPIADNAFNYYTFTLENSFYETNKQLINKIKVTPKIVNDPAMSGYIYIVDGTWEIYAVDLGADGGKIGQPLLDRLYIRQNFSYNSKEKVWVKNVQVLDFNSAVLGVGYSGRFSYVYSNFTLNPKFDRKTFNGEVVFFEPEANKKPDSFWNTIRPIPLTPEERRDYIKKDKLETLRSTEAAMDSIDHNRNRYKWPSSLLGYTYYNTHDNWKLQFTGLLLRLGFNTVQAYNLAPGFYFTIKNPKKNTTTTIGTDLNYGFVEDRFRMTGFISHKFNNVNNRAVSIAGGSSIEQFNIEKPITRIVNSISTLFFRENYMKLFDNNFIRLGYEEEVVNGLKLTASIEYTRKHALYNNTDFSTLKDAYKPYTSNNPLLPYDYVTPAFLEHHMYKAMVGARITFGQKYWTRPDGREYFPTDKYPRIYVKFEKGFASSIDDYNFNHLSTRITYHHTFDSKGEMGTNIRMGKFFNSENISFTDYRHFNGNQTNIGTSDLYLNVFNFLPYYSHSTNDQYFEGHFEYNFKGYLGNSVPLFNRLNYHLVTGYHFLAVPGHNPYMEFSAGLTNVGWGKFRYLRFDYVRSYAGGFQCDGIIFGLTFLDLLE